MVCLSSQHTRDRQPARFFQPTSANTTQITSCDKATVWVSPGLPYRGVEAAAVTPCTGRCPFMMLCSCFCGFSQHFISRQLINRHLNQLGYQSDRSQKSRRCLPCGALAGRLRHTSVPSSSTGHSLPTASDPGSGKPGGSAQIQVAHKIRYCLASSHLLSKPSS